MQKSTLVLLVPFLAGCEGLVQIGGDRDYPERHRHVVLAAGDEVPWNGVHDVVLAVKPFTINSTFEGTNFVYRRSETKWESDFQESFFVPPREMLTNAVRSRLAHSGIFRTVTGMSSVVPPTHFLEGHVSQLWIDLRKDKLVAVIELQFTLAREGTDTAKTAFTTPYKEEEPMTEDTPELAVLAWEEGLKKVMARLAKDLDNELNQIKK